MGDAIICGYALNDSAFQRLIQETPAMREIFPSYGTNSVQVYDRWRGDLPPESKKNTPKLRCKPDPKDQWAEPYFLFISRYTLFQNKQQFQHLRANGFLRETKRDKARLRRWLEFIKSCDGPEFREEEFRFDGMVDEDPGMYDF